MMSHDLVTTEATSHAPSENIESITEAAKEALNNMRRDSESYIAHARVLGSAIKGAKKLLRKGKFGEWRQSAVGLKPSQCSVYRQLYEAGPNLEYAREWARKIGHTNANTRDLRLLLRLVDEWWSTTGVDRLTKPRRKSRSKVFVVNSADRLTEQRTPISKQTPLPSHMVDAADIVVKATLQHRSATGDDLLDSVLEYIVDAVRSGLFQSCDIAQLSGPTPTEMHSEE